MLFLIARFFYVMKIPKSLSLRMLTLQWFLLVLALSMTLPLRQGFTYDSSNYASRPRPASYYRLPIDGAPSPPKDRGSLEDESLFYWLHITDTQAMWASQTQMEWYVNFSKGVFEVIKPKMIINSGDLVNSDYHGFFRDHEGQLKWEWERYRDRNAEAGLDNTTLYDVLGNHDVYNNSGV